MHARLHEQGEMGVGAQALIGHEDIAGVEGWRHRLHVGQVVGQEGCAHARQEPPGARLAPPQERCPRNAAPWPLRR